MRKLLKKQGFAPRLRVTDKLRSYALAFRRLGLSCRYEQGPRQNNRVSDGFVADDMPRAASNSSTIRNPSGKRKYRHPAWPMISAGNRYSA
jgi:transposase-like protein